MHAPISPPFRRTSFSCSRLLVAASCCLAFLLSNPLFAQDSEEDSGPKPEKLFESNETFTMTLSAPWRDIVRNAKVQDPYPATMQFTDSLGTAHNLPLTVERRGITRQVVCKYPPIKLRMDKEAMKGSSFRGQDELKLVTHCDKGDRWEQYYVKEYLAYRFFNEITERSYRAKPLLITYVDSESGDVDEPRFGFLIEDISDVAKRNELVKEDAPEIKRSQLDKLHASRVALFEYMISNVDFELLSGPKDDKCCHNARLIGTEDSTVISPIPYDFDSSGFVDAHYAVPNDFLGIRAVTQRLYRGYCAHNDTMEAARQEYIAKEADIMGLISGETRLHPRTAKTATKFVGEFFETIKNDKDYQKKIIGKCRK
jgi:hypothetical protein